jgi:hypothetical protein
MVKAMRGEAEHCCAGRRAASGIVTGTAAAAARFHAVPLSASGLTRPAICNRFLYRNECDVFRMIAARRPIVLILGMHRSGTSLLARIISHLGVSLGERLLNAPVPDNAGGYWEHADIVAVQDGLLHHFDRAWFGRHALSPLPPGWRDADATRRARAQLTAIVRAEVAAASGLWGFKDPRTLRFLPLWQDILDDLGLEPLPVLALRDPGSVAQSLKRRNKLSPRFAEAIWAFNVLEALEATAGRLAAVIDYDAWFRDPGHLCAQLCNRLSLPAPRALPQGMIDPAQRHGAGCGAAGRPEFVALYRALAASAPALAAEAQLTELRAATRQAIRTSEPRCRLPPWGRRIFQC